jgi:hypothetical protein
MKLLALFVLLACVGCTAPLAQPSHTPTQMCASLDATHRTWGAVAKFSGVVAGAGGLATLPIDSDEKALRASVAISALLIGGLSAASVYVEQDAAGAYARDCKESP